MPGSRALATRCPACGTVFRVVPDQLRVSDGWVRCGRCSEVFNAPETLVDMDTGARQRLPEVEPQSRVFAPNSAARPELVDFTATPPAADGAWAPVTEAAVEPPAQPSAESVLEPALEATLGPAVEPTAEAPPLPDPRAEPDDRPPPSFVRRAERAAHWRKPRVRLALGAGAGLAALALATQVVFTYRDLAAASWPALEPVLVKACAALRCEVGAPRLLAGLAVQSSGLSRVETSELYRLALTLRNQADIDLALPTIDLSLTDSQGRLLSRRVLPLAALEQVPGQALANAPGRLGAGRELLLQATLQISGAPADGPVAGYTIVLFYP